MTDDVEKGRPDMCGGTRISQNVNAPREIRSDAMVLFDVTSALNPDPAPDGAAPNDSAPLTYVSAFAAPAGRGTFLFLSTRGSAQWETKDAWALVKKDIFPSLAALVRKCDLAERNGFYAFTHGLPENFGGSVDIRYAGGERIHFSDNRSPLISHETGMTIAALFSEAMRGEAVPLPDTAALRSLRFEENRQNGGFTTAVLTIHPDGTGINNRKSRYDNPTVYESVAPVGKDTTDAIKKAMADTGILAWADLPDKEYSRGGDKRLTFIFEDGTTVTVSDRKILPKPLQQGFFTIELEMT